MFYSHELLTNRQYGVATIWLVATLGSKSNLRKVTRKAITDVNVPKACETITNPETPLALRLQASLLYGVSRVYSHQCGYMLTDMHNFKDKMKGIEQVMKDLEIDPQVGKMRPDQLNLPEDPTFNPEFNLNFDLGIFDIPSETSRPPSVLSSQLLPSSRTSLQGDQDEEEPGIEIRSGHTPGQYGGFDAAIGGATISVGRPNNRAGFADLFEDSAIMDDPGFEITADGDVVTVPTREEREQQENTSLEDAGQNMSEAAVTIEGAIGERNAVTSNELQGLDDEPVYMGDDEPPLPPARPFSPVPRSDANLVGELPQDEAQAGHQSESAAEGSATTTTAEAPQQRARRAKPLQIDERAELSNRQLNEWSHGYVANMKQMVVHKQQAVSAAQAKKNAAFWVLDQGIGGVEAAFGDDLVPHPLAVLSGQALLDMLRGREGSPMSSKRSRSPSAEADSEGRRVRARTEEQEQVGRGGIVNDDGIMIQGDDEMQIETEVGRHAASSLPDRSSAMPWNISGSRQGSAPALGSTGFYRNSSVGGAGGTQLGPRSLSRRGSRVTSASPLLGRALPQLPSEEGEEPTDLALDDEANFNPDDLGLQSSLKDFELYAPSVIVDTQEAGDSQWVRSTLEDEAHNFLEFVEKQIQDRGVAIGEGVHAEAKSISFEALLPAETSTKAVGAQGLLHVLSLATKGLIQVDQKEVVERGAIQIWVVSAQESGGGGEQPAEDEIGATNDQDMQEGIEEEDQGQSPGMVA